jgi:3-deoxy-7-phosphoheptulonate synthase
MGFQYIRSVPSSEKIKAEVALNFKQAQIKKEKDIQVREIFEGKSNKKLLVIGPCSADNEDAVMTYVNLLAEVQEKVKDKLILIPRIYTNKPRTTGEGYKGMLHQPDPNEAPDMLKGIYAIRSLHIRVIRETSLITADEMLYPSNYAYVDDIVSYVAVGARSVENQGHRLTCSGADIPVGMKNPTGGDLKVMLNSIKATQLGHSFIYNGFEVQSDGNPLAHAVLRGAVNQYGRNIPNYHYEDLLFLSKKYLESGLSHPAVIVDCNHANSMKRYGEQPRIANEVMRNVGYSGDIRKIVKGLMIESYLMDGTQPVGETNFGQSITDGCLGWKKSERLIYEIADVV